MKAKILIFLAYALFIVLSIISGYAPGKEIGINFLNFFIFMIKLLPAVFILIGLFEVWVKKETIEKHLGSESGFKGYLWSILLGSTTAGGLYVAFPVAKVLYHKGASLKVIFTYIGAAAICRIPMTTFEASFMGIKFTLIRLLVSIPLIILSSIILAHYLDKTGYKMHLMKKDN